MDDKKKYHFEGKKRKTFASLLIFVTIASIFVGLITLSPVRSATLPSFTSVNGNPPIYYIPVLLTNTQTSATSMNFTAKITMNSTANSAYYNTTLLNANWQDGNGNILSSWLESGETNTDSSTIYWVNLGVNTISANGGNITIYQCIYDKSVNCMNTVNTGAEPNYTGIYGQYDDGVNVFSNYWNFNGTTLPSGWSASGGSATVNNGITVPSSVQLTYLGMFTPGVVGDFYGYIPFSDTGWAYFGFYNTSSNQFVTFEQDAGGGAGCVFIVSGFGHVPYYGYGGNGYFSTLGVYSVNYISTTNVFGQINYAQQSSSISTYIQQFYEQISIGGGWTSGISPFAQWVRVRVAPPSGIMPSVTISPVQIYSALSCTLVGQTSNNSETSTLYSNWTTTGADSLTGASYLFSINSGSGYENQSWTAFSGSWANYSLTLSSYAIGTTIEWVVYAKDAAGIQFSSNAQSFMVQANVTYYFTEGGELWCDGISIANGSSVIHQSPVTMAAIISSGYSFTSYNWSYPAASSSTSNAFIFTPTGDCTFWAYMNTTIQTYIQGFADGNATGFSSGWIDCARAVAGENRLYVAVAILGQGNVNYTYASGGYYDGQPITIPENTGTIYAPTVLTSNNSQTIVQLTANPSDGYTFDHWIFNDGVNCTSVTINVSVSQCQLAVAVFVPTGGQ